MGEPPVGTVTFLFTDIEGSTRLARATGAVWQDVLGAHHDAVERAIERHGGYVDAIEGDAFVGAFADARGAVDAALDAQRALAAAAWPREIEPLRVRMGVHTGYVERTELGYVGLEVHRAARVGAAAHGGQILATAATCALLRDETEVEDLGEHRLKDFPARSGSFTWCATDATPPSSARCTRPRHGRRTCPRTSRRSWAATANSTTSRRCSGTGSGS